MFNNCKSLLSLDISNFYLTNILFFDNMCNGVSNLKYINLYNLSADKLFLVNLFSQLPENLSICIDEENEIIYDVFSNIKKYIIFVCTEDFNNVEKKMLKIKIALIIVIIYIISIEIKKNVIKNTQVGQFLFLLENIFVLKKWKK